MTPQQAQDLIATLEDEAARQRLIEQLQALAAVQEADDRPILETAGSQLLDTLSNRLGEIGAQLSALAAGLTDLPRFVEWVQDEIESPVARRYWLGLISGVSAALVVGALASLLLHVLLRGARKRIEERAQGELLGRLVALTGRTIVDLLPLFAFVLAGYAAITLLEPSRAARVASVALINAFAMVGVVVLLARAVLAPRVARLRLIRIDDSTAGYLYIWVRRFAFTIIAGFIVAEAGITLGMAPEVRSGVMAIVGLLLVGMLIAFILQNRRYVAGLIAVGPAGTAEQIAADEPAEAIAEAPSESDLAGGLGRPSRSFLSLRARLADVWHILAIAYVAVAYVIWLLQVEGGFAFMLEATVLSLAIIVAAGFARAGVKRGLQRIFRVDADLKARTPGLEARANRYLPVIDRLVGIVIVLLALLTVADVWGLGAFNYLQSEVGRALITSLLAVVFVLIFAVVAWELVSALIERRLEHIERQEHSLAQKARLRTLLPLLRNAFLVVLITVATLIVLSELGINIAPLLAGAGVVGLAIGFGAQTLVKDVITGLFNLFENTIAVGDVVNIAGQGGLVEGMTIRTVRLRDLSGNVYTIPFSEVTTVMNMTRDFSYYLFDIGVAYRENVDEVIQVIRELGAEMQEDQKYRHLILEPIEVLGVDQFADSAVVIKARFKTTPINQWTVGREFNRRMKNRFDELGIEIPFPHMTLYFGQDKQGAAPPARLQMGAPELVEALAARGARAAPTGRPKGEQPEGFRTPEAVGDAPAHSTPGHSPDD